MKLGLEWRGKLPPGAQEMLEQSIISWKEAENAGLKIEVEVLGPTLPPCPVAAKLAGKKFPLSLIPRLPLDGCTHSPCCACGYSATVHS